MIEAPGGFDARLQLLEERIRNLQLQLAALQTTLADDFTKKHELTTLEKSIVRELQILNQTVEKLVPKAEFTPVRTIVFGLVGASLLALLAAILSLVIRSLP